ncbi:MAG: response regulator [Verrucomicrobiota bacterium]
MNDAESNQPAVLLVEDDPTSALVLRTMLEKEGYAVQHCSDGEAALQSLAQRKFDAVVLDLMMPKIDGMEVLKTMRSYPEHLLTPVILLTAAKLKIIEDQAALYRVNLYLERTQVSKLRGALRELLANPAERQRETKLRMANPGLLAPASAPDEADGKGPRKGLARLFGRKS